MTSQDTNLVRFIAIFAIVFCAIVALATAVGTGNRKVIVSMATLIAVVIFIFLIALALLR